MSNLQKSMREKIIESSVVIGALLIFFGFLKQYWYYNSFGIPIHQYLSLDEILILFFADLAYICELVLWVSLYIVFLCVLLKVINLIWGNKINSNVEISDTNDTVGNVLDNLFENKKIVFWIFIISLLLTVIGVFWFYYTNSLTSIIYLALFSCQTVLSFLDWLKNGIKMELSIIVIVVMGLFVLLYCKNINDVRETKSSYNFYTIELNNTTIETSLDTLYLGKSQDYIFFYNNIKSESIIVKNDEINSIKIFKKR